MARNRQKTGIPRSQRVGDLLIEFVSRLLTRSLNDPRLASVTLTATDVRPDLKHATLYFTVRDGEGSRDEALLGLRAATGFIRSRIAVDLDLRFVPDLEFVHDDAPERARRIEDLLSQVRCKA